MPTENNETGENGNKLLSRYNQQTSWKNGRPEYKNEVKELIVLTIIIFATIIH